MAIVRPPISLAGPTGLTGHPGFPTITAAPPSDFRATVQRYESGPTWSAELTRLTPCVLRQEDARIPATPEGEVVKAAVADTASRLRLADGAVEVDCAAGQLVLFSPHRRLDWTFTEPTRLAVLSIPARLVDQCGEAFRRTGATVLDSPLSGATADFVTQFVLDTTAGRHGLGPGDVRAVIELIRGALALQEQTYDEYVRAAVRERIERDFANPDLSASVCAEGLGMSRRQLYRFFSGSEATVAGLITARRIEHVRTLLDAPESIRLTEVATASGFRSVGTLRRRFEAVVGQTPTEYRARVVAERGSTTLTPILMTGPRRPALPVSAVSDYV